MSKIIYDIFGMPYEEAIAFLKNKSNLSTKHWDDLLGASHIRSFTVAGALKKDLLKDLHTAVQSAIDNGSKITNFRKDFAKIVHHHGWNYKGSLGWRSRIIYDTNLRTAQAAGKWQKIQEIKKERPFLKYITAGDERVRDAHSNWNNLILPTNDKFWDTHYPPNGWGCRCTVRTLNKFQAKKSGINKAPKIKKTERINAQTGEIYGLVPVGIDTGWDYNVGKDFFNN